MPLQSTTMEMAPKNVLLGPEAAAWASASSKSSIGISNPSVFLVNLFLAQESYVSRQ